MNLEQSIVREIENCRSISFARFMELALYAPELGYYEQKARVGRAGDFYTSVSVGNLFGELLAWRFAEWLAADTSGAPMQILESGANDGQLASDVLMAFQRHAPEVFARIRYCILEPSVRHRDWQRETLKTFRNIYWAKDWTEVEPFSGIIFSNELLDAMPFQRLQWNAVLRKWDEMKVGWEGGQFAWKVEAIPNETPGLPQISVPLAEVMPNGFQTEISPSALNWWEIAVGKLKHGSIMAIDYGLMAEEFFSPERGRGTARSYSRHHLGNDLLSNVGEQDITSHVNFTAIMEAGESAGMQTTFFGPQSRFLTTILEEKLRSGVNSLDRKAVAQFQTLTHPTHLGTKFKVLIQRKSP